jgi:Tfp pilus assembly ATPase PilU
MLTNARIADLIRENRAEEITDAIAEGEFFQMQTFTHALIEHVRTGLVDREVAANAAGNRHDFLVALDKALKQDAVAQPVEAQAPAEQPAEPAETLPILRIVQPAEG